MHISNNPRTRRRAATSGFLPRMVALLICLLGCDGSMDVIGQVLEWRNPPNGAKGKIYINEAPPSNRTLSPVPGADVKLYYMEDYGEPVVKNDQDHDRYGNTMTTKVDGTFGLAVATPPYHITAAVRVKRKGFHTLLRTFPHPRSGKYEITALLVRKSNDGVK